MGMRLRLHPHFHLWMRERAAGEDALSMLTLRYR